MRWLLLLFSIFSFNVFSQANKDFLIDFLLEDELKPENYLKADSKFDFSALWTQTENCFIVGTIGSDFQRIKIKLIEVNKSISDSVEYRVKGKSSVKGNICQFIGTITITEIREVEQLHLGVDQIYADSGLKAEGIIIADYKFAEDF